jgi:hypothetical protein
MQNIICDLKEVLITRMNKELERVQQLQSDSVKETLLISAGKIIEIEHLIDLLDHINPTDVQTLNIRQ